MWKRNVTYLLGDHDGTFCKHARQGTGPLGVKFGLKKE